MVFGWQELAAQDSLSLQATERYALSYLEAVSEYAALFTGRSQQPLSFFATNHQYFKEEKFVSGKLSYGGVVYPGVFLRWDLYRDEIEILTPDNNVILLKNEYIGFAEIYGYHIFYLNPDGFAGCPPAGNYIRLYLGDYLLIEKCINKIQSEVNPTLRHLVYKFVTSSTFYLQNNGVYYKINNRRTLMKSLDGRHTELKQFIRANKLKYKHDAEKMVSEVVKQHEKLNQQ